MQILWADLYKGFGPTLASEYLADKHDIEVSKETVRQWMMRAKLWRAKAQKVNAVHGTVGPIRPTPTTPLVLWTRAITWRRL